MKQALLILSLLTGMASIDWLFLRGEHHGVFWQDMPAGYGFFGLLISLLLMWFAKTVIGSFVLRSGDDDD